MSKVYVTQEVGGLDYLPAEDFGEIQFITRSDVSNIKGSLNNDALIREIRMALHRYNQDEDWIVVTGSPYVACLVFMVLGWRSAGKARFLRWSNRDKRYAPIEIDVHVGHSGDD